MNICEITGLQLSKVGKGRFAVKVPSHPKANNSGYVLRYRYIMEQKLGRYLKSNEEVHHIDEDSSNDVESNLMVLTKSAHAKLHGNFDKRTLDYDWIKKLRLEGLGYKKISNETGYSRSSVRYSCKVMNM